MAACKEGYTHLQNEERKVGRVIRDQNQEIRIFIIYKNSKVFQQFYKLTVMCRNVKHVDQTCCDRW